MGSGLLPHFCMHWRYWRMTHKAWSLRLPDMTEMESLRVSDLSRSVRSTLPPLPPLWLHEMRSCTLLGEEGHSAEGGRAAGRTEGQQRKEWQAAMCPE